MNFFRFCELIELAAPDAAPIGTTDSPSTEPVRFRSRARLGFPGSEIDCVEFDDDNEDKKAPPTVRTTFLGLYGVDARMPSYFVDEVAQNRDGAEPLAAFLDVFHHRIVTQLYRVWRKYRYPVGYRQGGTDPVSRYLLSYVGLGFNTAHDQRAKSGVDPRTLMSMLGVVAQKTRTAEGLAGVLQHAVPDAKVQVEEFFPVWREVNDFEPAALGEQCLLGRGFYDRSNAVRVIITPDTRETVLSLTPGHAAHREIMALLRFYLGYEGEAHLEMHVRPELMPDPVLVSRQTSLGLTSQLPPSSAQHKNQHITRVHLGRWNGSNA
ncbi:type VI secretion system baseplate subunit TssG [Caballeronia sp. LZ025]|uniref:type VI secretion system baseplate subunit TssG n=1 Tax=Caballeronia TaxID=1827195 RepID=UPI001FD3D1A1|nr:MULTISPECIES: type VI secretion system baseplate subunit TssG [Caballeronia]MDR5735831.1 type VI secretion system baseplate subunit TssG [Caballeronia sp. LZ025]